MVVMLATSFTALCHTAWAGIEQTLHMALLRLLARYEPEILARFDKPFDQVHYHAVAIGLLAIPVER